MPSFLSTPAFTSRRLSALALALCIAVLLFQQGARAVQPTDALKFFNNYFVTGGYVVAGVGLWNTGSGSINMASPMAPMTAAPEGADVLAAYLYWQVVTSVNPDVVPIHATSTFNGAPLSTPLGFQLPVNLGGTQACLLNGGSGNTVYSFRADVQRFLDVDGVTGRRVVNKEGGYPVSLPNDGSTRTLGASLVVIYRHPNPATPLNAIVVYDGTFVKQQPQTLRQRIEGFYDAASVPGIISYVAGSAQSGLNEILRIDTDGDPATVPAGTQSLFDGAAGNAWDNVTRQTSALTDLALAGGYLDTSIAPQTTGPLGFLVNDCVAMGAIIYQTPVNDEDGDGLLDKWETSESLLLDPKGLALPRFKAMGAEKSRRDAFVEVAAMRTLEPTTYGSAEAPLKELPPFSVTDALGHNHMPTPVALQKLGEAYAAAPVDPRYSAAGAGIAVHFDVGPPSVYKALLAHPGQSPMESPYNSSVADAYIIGAGVVGQADETLARGGELILETACEPGPISIDHDHNPETPNFEGEVDCQFPDYPGTVSWKTGFQLYKEAHFDDNRKDSFRFGLYAHAKATPKSLLPCTGPEGGVAALSDGNCAEGASPNPLIHVPAGVSGTADFPGGGDYLVTLGLWDNTNFVGTAFGVAATTMHELGHTFGLGHGGDALPNCKPNYLSVMNYMFQLGGLIDVDGVANLGYSGDDFANIDENGELIETYTVPSLYRTSWYAPWSEGDGGTPAKRFCNGLKFPVGWPQMVRIDGTPGGEIDWNADGDTVDSLLLQDVNFDGEPDLEPGGPTTTLTGFNDWTSLRLNQVGSRRNFGGYSIGPLGVELLADGSQILADGSQILADGSWLLADGVQFLGDGVVFLGDGSHLLSDGAELLADGSTLLADGAQILADGSRFLADGATSEGAELLADGAVFLSDGSALLADGSVFLADGVQFLSDGAVLLGDGVELLADGAVFLGDGSPLLADGSNLAWAWDVSEPTPKSAAETGNIPGPTELNVTMTSDPDVPALNHRFALSWKAPSSGDVILYNVYRAEADSVPPGGEPTFTVPGSVTSALDLDELPNGLEVTYVVEGVLADGEDTTTPRSNQRTVTALNEKPTATPQMVVVWEDFLSDPITLAGADVDSAGVEVFSVQTGSEYGGIVTPTLPNVSYLSAANYNGPDSFTFTVKETSTFESTLGNQNQESDPGTVTLTVSPVNDRPSFTKGSNQTVTQPVGTQTVAGWVAGFDAGPRPCSGSCVHEDSQSPLAYIVSNDNAALFDGVLGQPAIAPDGTLTYTPKAGASGMATVTARVQDNGGIDELHGGLDTSHPAETFTITVLPPPGTPISFQRVDAWMTTSTSNRKFDLKAQVLRNGEVVAQKEITNLVVGLGSSFTKAVYTQIQPLIPATSFAFTTTDTLSVKLWVRLASSSGGGNSASAEVRFWYNTPGNNSHLHATRAGTTVKYYIVKPFKLQTNPAQAPGGTQYISLNVKQGEGYKEFGTWSITGP